MYLQDNEYVVYETCQQKLAYVVEFSLPGDKVMPRQVKAPAMLEDDDASITTHDNKHVGQ